MTDVYRDAYGIPHLRAESVHALARLQGRVTALDRARQLDVERRRSEGRLAELIGPAELPWDRFARRARLDDTARRCYSRLSAETRTWLESYADGVRSAGLEWQPWSSLGVFLVQHILFGTFPTKMWRAHVERTLGTDAVAWFSAEGRDGSGSNAWMIPGEIAGDPHRLLELPGVYQQVRLACPEFDVAGFTFPGVAGVQHFGHTGTVAWAVTNAMADYQDLYQEDLRRTPAAAAGAGGVSGRGGPGPRLPDLVEVRSADGWEPAAVHFETIAVHGGEPEVVEIVETPRGPLVDGDLALRTPTRADFDLGFDALLPLLRARTAQDVADAFAHWVEPVNSLLVADSSGTMLQLAAGKVPVRSDRARRFPVPAWDPAHAWTGYEPMPRIPVQHSAVNANDRRADTQALGVDFAPPTRARRIRELLDAGTPAERIHMDTAVPADSVQAGRRAAYRALVARRLTGHPALAALRVPHGHDPFFAPWTDVASWVGRSLTSLLRALGLTESDLADPAELTGADSPAGRQPAEPPRTDIPAGRQPAEPPRTDIPAGRQPAQPPRTDQATGSPAEGQHAGSPRPGNDAGSTSGQDLDDVAAGGWRGETWGERHLLAPIVLPGLDVDFPRVRLSGDTDSVLCTSSIPGVSDACWRGPVARYVWDLTDRQRSRWIVPFGASGEPGSPHFLDQLPHWAAGELVQLVTDWNRLTKDTTP